MKLERKLLPIETAALKAADGAEFVFEGWASKFGGLDSYNDTIMPGAYKDTLASGRKVSMYFNHISRRSDMAARIGTWELGEKEEGLWVRGTMVPDHPLVKNIWPSIKAGLLSGLSIGYSVPEGGAVALPNGVRQLHKIDLYEVSVVEDPADDAARIESAKFFADCYTERDFEHSLRESGLSKTEALAAVACARGIWAPKSEASKADDELVAALKTLYVKKA